MKKILIFLIFGLLTISSVSSIHNLDYISDISQLVSSDCEGKDIIIKKEFIINLLDGQEINLIKESNWNNETIKEIMQIFDSNNYDPLTMLPCDPTMRILVGDTYNGCNLLRCGAHNLDAMGDNFYWDNVKFEQAKTEYIYAQTFGDHSPVTTGDYSPVTTGNYSPIVQKNRHFLLRVFCSEGTIGGIIISGILYLAKFLISGYKKHKKTKPNKNKRSKTLKKRKVSKLL